MASKKHASKTSRKRVMMTYEAPEAQSVVLTGSFCDWETKKYTLKSDGNGT